MTLEQAMRNYLVNALRDLAAAAPKAAAAILAGNYDIALTAIAPEIDTLNHVRASLTIIRNTLTLIRNSEERPNEHP